MYLDGLSIALITAICALASALMAADHYRRSNQVLQDQSEQQRQEVSRLMERELGRQVLFEHSPVGCLVWESGFRIVDWNNEAERIFGWSRQEAVGESLLALLIPVHARAQAVQVANEILLGNAPKRMEFPALTRDGRQINCEWRHAMMRVKPGSPIRVVSLCINLSPTEQLQNEIALFRSIIDLTDDPVVMLYSLDSRQIVYASAAASRHFGMALEDLIGSSPKDWDAGLDEDSEQEIVLQTLTRGSYTFQTRHRHRDGHLIPVEVTNNLIEHDGRRYLTGYIRDITRRQEEEARQRELQVKAAVADQERRYQEVFDNSANALIIFSVDGQGTLVFDGVNPAAEQALGRPAALLNQTPLADTPLDRLMDRCEECLASGMPNDYEGPLSCRNEGEEGVAQFFARLVPMADDGGIERIIVVANDITAHKLHAAELQERVRLEERMSRFFASAPGFFLTLLRSANGRWQMPFASPGIRDTHGIEPDAAIADFRRFNALTHPEDRNRVTQALLVSAQKLTNVAVEHRIMHTTLGERWVEFIARPHREDDGGTVWHGFIHDITRRKLTERQLTLLKHAVESFADPFLICDDSLRLVEVNAAVGKLLGYSRDELLAMTLPEVRPDAGYDDEMIAVADLNPGGANIGESVYKRKDGSIVPVEIVATSFELEGERYRLGTARDISSRTRIKSLLHFIANPGPVQEEGGFLIALARRLAVLLDIEHVAIYRLSDDQRAFRPAVVLSHGQLLAEPPAEDDSAFCAVLAAAGHCFYHEGASHRFPPASLPVRLGSEGLIGIPLLDSRGALIGCLALMSARPLAASGDAMQLAELAAPRAAAELERERSDEELRASERQFRTLADNLPDNVIRYSPDARVLYLNRKAEQVLGISAAQLVGSRPSERPYSQYAAYYEERIRATVALKTSDVEIELPGPNGDIRHHQIRLVAEQGAGGEVTSIIAVGRDITSRRLTEETLRLLTRRRADLSTESFFRNIVRHLSRATHTDCILIERFGEEAGVSETIAICAHGQIMPNHRRQLRLSPWDGHAGGDIVVHTEGVRQIFPDDPLLESLSAERYVGITLWDSHNRPTGIIAAMDRAPSVDNGLLIRQLQLVAGPVAAELERERIDSLLRKSERSYRTLVENSPDVIIRYDAEGRRLYVNPAYETVFAAPSDAILGRNVDEVGILPPNLAKEYAKRIQSVIVQRETENITLEYPSRDGRIVHLHAYFVPEQDDEGRVVSVLMLSRDISVLRETEIRLRDSQAMLRSISARRESAREDERKRIAHDLHEELGQLLTALRINISTLPMQYAQALPAIVPRTQQMLGLVDKTIQGMRNVVTSLRPTALNAGIAVGLEWLASQFSEHTGLDCQVRLPESGFELADEAAIMVFRIVQEAFTNIARHAQANSARLEVEEQQGHWRIEISDDGRGLGTEPHRPGAFGLFGMRERASLLGGRLEVTAAPGRGTAIRLWIPAHPLLPALGISRPEADAFLTGNSSPPDGLNRSSEAS